MEDHCREETFHSAAGSFELAASIRKISRRIFFYNKKALTRGRTDHFGTKNSTKNEPTSRRNVNPQSKTEHFLSVTVNFDR